MRLWNDHFFRLLLRFVFLQRLLVLCVYEPVCEFVCVFVCRIRISWSQRIVLVCIASWCSVCVPLLFHFVCLPFVPMPSLHQHQHRWHNSLREMLKLFVHVSVFVCVSLDFITWEPNRPSSKTITDDLHFFLVRVSFLRWFSSISDFITPYRSLFCAVFSQRIPSFIVSDEKEAFFCLDWFFSLLINDRNAVSSFSPKIKYRLVFFCVALFYIATLQFHSFSFRVFCFVVLNWNDWKSSNQMIVIFWENWAGEADEKISNEICWLSP